MTNTRDRRLFLVSTQPNESQMGNPERQLKAPALPGPVLDEVMLDGRRYRLVPIDAEPLAEIEPWPAPSALTAREAQIARLVADGFVNKQVAAELRISEWTVATHLRRIFAKLGVETRAAMVSKCFGGIRR